jgi:hypothetical protein
VTSLDGRVFAVVEVSPASEISAETRFEFRERDGVVEADYAGGEIVTGHIVGRREGDVIRTAYAQLRRDGGLSTGGAEMRIESAPDGAVLLVEDYVWSDGTPGVNVLRSQPR